jgi:serine/threonine protein kinase
VADFGLARIKEDNATMTRCGTPCWTAPEVIRGERYDERADVYSFGIIALADLIQACWHAKPSKRPSMLDVIGALTTILGDDDDAPV